MPRNKSPFQRYLQDFMVSSGLIKKEIFGLSSVGVIRIRRILDGGEPSGKELIQLCLMISEVERRPVQIILYEVLRAYIPRSS